MPRKIYFRADGNSKMGLGHIFRSLALADMLRADFECYFMVREPLKALKSKIQSVSTLIELPQNQSDIEEATSIANDYFFAQDIVVLDGYHFRTEYQEIIKETGAKLVCIDDIYAYHFVADVIINHAGGLNPDIYSKEAYTKCCLGLEYALLQAPFLQAGREKDYSQQEADSLFICLGGADPNNDMLQVLKIIETINPDAKIRVVLGASYMHIAELDAFANNSKLSIQKLSNLSAPEMVHYMRISETKICSPSTISYECLSVGGTLYLYSIADNQASIFKYFTETELAFDFVKDYPILENSKKEKAIALQESLLNGQSFKNLLAIFKQL